MSTLYLLGGPPRTAKTTIMSGLAKEQGVAFIAADAIEHGVRNVLTGEPHQMLRGIELTGSAEWKTSITEGGERKPFSNKGTESELTLQAVIGMLDYYRRNKESVAFEGAAFTPEWVKNLKVADFTIRAAFVGFTNPAHADQIIAFAKDNPHDWINVWLEKDGGDETKIREWVTKQSEKCVELKSEAEQSGYPFFDISTMSFEDYVTAAQQYFLENN
jgi:hypothetical protein